MYDSFVVGSCHEAFEVYFEEPDTRPKRFLTGTPVQTSAAGFVHMIGLVGHFA